MTLTIRRLAESELSEAVDVLADGLRDNPLHCRVFGEDPVRREEALRRLYPSVARRIHARGYIEGAFRDGRLVGLCGRLSPGNCQVGLLQALAFLPTLKKGNSWGSVVRVSRWGDAFSRNDPDAPHWHFGPIAVRREEQGQGIGRELMRSYCAQVDAERAASYLETDTETNVRIYGKIGFAVTGTREVLGTPCWFMSRPPA